MTWDGALSGVLTVLLFSLVLACWTMSALHSPQAGWDFPVFYIAAHLPQSSLYDSHAFAEYWRIHLQGQGVPHWAPFVRLPLFAIPLHYLLNMPYYPALWWWTALGGLSYIAAGGLLTWKLRLPLPILAACALYFPAAVGIINGADIGFYFLVVVVALLFLEGGEEWLAAFALTLCLSKYNLIALIPLVLGFQRRYRALGGFMAGALLVGSLSLCSTSVKTYLAAVEAAPGIAGHFHPVGLRGFAEAIERPLLYPILAVIVVAICCYLFWRLDLRNSIAAAITGALMISPYVTWYDSTLLILPILVVFSNSGRTIRALCILLLVTIPIWVFGGGFGPTGFTHVTVEFLLTVWFVYKARKAASLKLPKLVCATINFYTFWP